MGRLLDLHQSLADGVQHSLGAVVDVEFGEDVGNVVLHRLLADAELTGDLFVAEALCQQFQDVHLPIGQRVDLFEADISSSGNTSNPVRWDLSESKIPLTQGVYVYNIILKNDDGVIASKSGKLLVI